MKVGVVPLSIGYERANAEIHGGSLEAAEKVVRDYTMHEPVRYSADRVLLYYNSKNVSIRN